MGLLRPHTCAQSITVFLNDSHLEVSIVVIVSVSCQHDRIQDNLGGSPLCMALKNNLITLIKVGKPTHCGGIFV